MEAIRYAMVKNNTVYDVCLWDGDISRWQPPNDGTIMIANEWASPGDWYEESENRFYRPMPNNDDQTETAE